MKSTRLDIVGGDAVLWSDELTSGAAYEYTLQWTAPSGERQPIPPKRPVVGDESGQGQAEWPVTSFTGTYVGTISQHGYPFRYAKWPNL